MSEAMTAEFFCCNICTAPGVLPGTAAGTAAAAAAAQHEQVLPPPASICLLSCKHLVCDPCLSKLRGPNGQTYCPFCKTPVRSIRTDDPDKLPPNIRALLFGNPVDMQKQAAEVWEFQNGHAIMSIKAMEKELKRVREEGAAELERRQERNRKMEAENAQGLEDIRKLKEKKRALEQQAAAEKAAQRRPAAYLPRGSVKSPPVMNPTGAQGATAGSVQSQGYDFFKNINKVTSPDGSCIDMPDAFSKEAGLFKTPHFK